MRFIHKNQIELPQLRRLAVHRLNPRNHNPLFRITTPETRRIHPDLQIRTQHLNLRCVLFQQLLDVRKNQDAAPPELDRV